MTKTEKQYVLTTLLVSSETAQQIAITNLVFSLALGLDDDPPAIVHVWQANVLADLGGLPRFCDRATPLAERYRQLTGYITKRPQHSTTFAVALSIGRLLGLDIDNDFFSKWVPKDMKVTLLEVDQ